MPELLLELFSEEIPARMQKRAEEDLARLLGEKLGAAELKPETLKTYSTPRRLVIVAEGLAAATPDTSEERKGPRVGAPEAAIQGFLRGAGLASIDQAKVQADAKGDFYVARIEKKGRATAALIGEIVPEIIRAFPWPKSMRSGVSDLTWVRPLQNICCVFDGAEIVIALDGAPSKAETRGHRFHAPDAFPVGSFAAYAAGLAKAHVILDREERKAIILREARALTAARGFELVEDAGLLDEVAGLVEWPVPLLGDMDPAFLDLPGEIIRLTMRTHQKYFAVRDPKTGRLAPHFIAVANISAKDGGAAIAAGNARVLAARLNDARFFWDSDRKLKLDDPTRIEKLKQIVFHAKLGSVWDKVGRVRALARELCAVTGADADLVDCAAQLCKCDLVTETVGEFPELQGQVGRALYLAELGAPSPLVGEGREGGRSKQRAPIPTPPTPGPSPQGGGENVAAAIEDHYRPLGPNDRVPTDPVAVTLALADKLDTLVGFWAIDEKPTGSSDAYGLRRAALGFVRIVLANDIRFSAPSPLAGEGREGGRADRGANGAVAHNRDRPPPPSSFGSLRDPSAAGGPLLSPSPQGGGGAFIRRAYELFVERWFNDSRFVVLPDGATLVGHDKRMPLEAAFANGLLAFLAERLKVQLREQGKRHDLVDAVFAPNPNTGEVDDDLVRIVARVEALDAFLKTDNGANLLAGSKRAANIVRAEEKKESSKNSDLSTLLQSGEYPQERLFSHDAERALHAALIDAQARAKAAVAQENFTAAMEALARLRAPVDQFFEDVLVNAPENEVRLNRLALLTRMRAALNEVADFSKIEG